MARALVFPGQGSQAVGMGEELLAAFPIARETLEEVDDALGENLTKLITDGPMEELTLTENAQPALMAVSMAIIRVLEKEGGVRVDEIATFLAGHSLGEYSALAAARSFGLADAARLLRIRGQAMQEAVPVGKGGMAALLGAELDQAKEIAIAASDGEICSVANDNAPGQVVLSGAMDAIDRAIEIASERDIRRTVKLAVSAPFHCSMMAPAAEIMERALSEVTVVRPLVRVMTNVTAAPVDNPDEIKSLLVEQVTSMVRWRESVLAMRDGGVDTLIELGPGKVLSGLTKRIDRDLRSINAATPDEIEAVLKTL
ncbi:MAG: Malonyl CoA-acyl carrier protein transacylase [Alphaproteobacteria bacterium MarineAlpha11_Bin1]|nr:MAG: Malonyl CoA-acyl carrier protein transacylase [Alphaproteobacteria bacterium MarineAlpha11_Bin1]|tara:strand:- start:3715 stop:4656 length:942 start_codon:yes stop_codon:yes gene_type:complete